MNEDIDWNLLAKYLSDECSEEEEARIRDWIEEDPSRKMVLEEIKLVRQLTGESSEPGSWETEELWERVQSEIGRQSSRHDPGEHGDRSAQDVPNGRSRQTSTEYHRGHSRAHRFTSGLRLLTAAMTAIVVVGFTVFWLNWPVQTDQWLGSSSETKVFSTQAGEQATLRLNDGSHVRLNVDSRLTLTSSFGEEQRMVELEGEAFFDVEKDSMRPFMVRTDGFTARVLGTSFGVTAYPEQQGTSVVVSEGKVEVTSDTSSTPQQQQRSMVLSRHQMGRFLRSGEQFFQKDIDVDRKLSWREGRVVFEKAPFEKVVRRIERWYSVRITVEDGGSMPSGKLNAKFDGEQSLSEVLKIIAMAFGLEYERDGKHVKFSVVQEAGSS